LDLMNPEKLIREQRQIFSELIKMKYRRLPEERYQV